MDIIDIIQQLKCRMRDDDLEKDVERLDNIINKGNLKALLQIHETLRSEFAKDIESFTSTDLVHEVHQFLEMYPRDDILAELSSLFHTSHHLVALLTCHDKVANKEFDEPQLTDISIEDFSVDDKKDEETMKVVRLVKSDEPLGATITTDEITGNTVIARILKGGAADRSGLIHENDTIVEINGVSANDKKPGDLIKLLSGFTGPLTFKLIPGERLPDSNEDCMHIRSRFTFQPQNDNLIPCKEAGLDFYPGDVLRVVSKVDKSWWQAYKVKSGDSEKQIINKRAGLIPSMKLQIRREKLQRQAQTKLSKTSSIRGSKASLLREEKKNTYNASQQGLNLPPYEMVTNIGPVQECDSVRAYRPIVLVGPQGVGRNELKDRLIDSNPSHYGVPIPHTSRSKHEGEEDGKDYHFVPRGFMENGIKDSFFFEYGEYKGSLYGTSIEAVERIIQNGQVCVLTPYPQGINALRVRKIKPFVVFVKPHELWKNDKNNTHKDEVHNLIKRAEVIESTYGRLFDSVIVNDNPDSAFSQLKDITFFLENNHQWVPDEWVQ